MIGPMLPPWRTANCGSGKHRWFLFRGNDVPFRHRWHTNVKDDLIWYASRETALRAADRLNAAESSGKP